MGGGDGSSAPSSAPQTEPAEVAEPVAADEFPAPEFLFKYLGKGKYNIGFVGPSGSGKSSLLNDILGASLARSGATECTQEPAPYELPLEDPRGHFEKFIKRLPDLHQKCVTNKLRSVTLWDLPGAGTRLHPSQTYVRDKGLRYFDFVVDFVGERVLEVDHELVASLLQHEVKHFLCRSKLDVVLNTYLKEKKDELDRRLSPDEKFNLASGQMQIMRKAMVDELQVSLPDFHGQLYLVAAMAKVDDEAPNFGVIQDLQETQLAIDRLLLDVIEDRHNHDLRQFFDDSMYGKASKIVFNWFFKRSCSTAISQVACADVVAQAADQGLTAGYSSGSISLGDSHAVEQAGQEPATSHEDNLSEVGTDVQPEDSVSQVAVAPTQNDWIHLPSAETAHSIITEDATSQFSDLSFSLVSVPSGEPHCFMPEALFKLEGDVFRYAKNLLKGMHVMAANGKGILVVTSIARETTQEVVELRTSDAYIEVTANHRVMIPSFEEGATSPRNVRARMLQPSDSVLCSVDKPEKLVSVETVKKETDVFAITFRPDSPVLVFSVPNAIQTKGAKHNAKRRGKKPRPRIPDTDSDIGMPFHKVD